MKRVYIAGKYDDTNVIQVLKNIRVGIKASVKALRTGYIPFCPWLDFMFALVGGGEELTDAEILLRSGAQRPHL